MHWIQTYVREKDLELNALDKMSLEGLTDGHRLLLLELLTEPKQYKTALVSCYVTDANADVCCVDVSVWRQIKLDKGKKLIDAEHKRELSQDANASKASAGNYQDIPRFSENSQDSYGAE